MRNIPPSTCSMRVDRKLISGNASASKKSGDRKCWSRSACPVSMLATIALPETRDSARCSAATIVPSNSRNWPRTVAIIMCRTSKLTLECDGSTVQVPDGTRTIPCSVCNCVAMATTPFRNACPPLWARRAGVVDVAPRGDESLLHPVNRRGDQHPGAEQLRKDKQDERGTAGRRLGVRCVGSGFGFHFRLRRQGFAYS